jgi:hypothetical protein
MQGKLLGKEKANNSGQERQWRDSNQRCECSGRNWRRVVENRGTATEALSKSTQDWEITECPRKFSFSSEMCFLSQAAMRIRLWTTWTVPQRMELEGNNLQRNTFIQYYSLREIWNNIRLCLCPHWKYFLTARILGGAPE